jgi:hypothetical protein
VDYIILDLVTKTQFIRMKYTEQVGNIKPWSRYMNGEDVVDWDTYKEWERVRTVRMASISYIFPDFG